MRTCALVLLWVLPAAAACTPSVSRPPALPVEDSSAKLATAERQVLAALGVVDGRLERRFGTHATDAELHHVATQMIVSEDPDSALVDGRVDVFSFAARERALFKLKEHVPKGALPADARLERELLLRLIDAERARIDQEKSLPGASSELVRGVVSMWSVPGDEEALAVRDAWLARRLGEVEASLSKAPLPRGEQYELEDALDPLEARIRAGYTQSLQALAKLRIALAQAPPAKPLAWPPVAEKLAPQIGAVPSPEIVMARLQTLERSLRPPSTPDDAAERAVKTMLLDASLPCTLEGRGSIVRGLGAPPERDLACRVIAAVSKNDPAARLAMHRVVALALMTIAAHAGLSSPVTIQTAPELGVRAGGRPVDFVVAALAVEWIHAGTDPRERASRWVTFGDAPLDVAFRELH